MRILVIDTATRRANVAAVQGGVVLAAAEHEGRSQHAEALFDMVRGVLAEAGWERGVELLAVGMGPGSFTGVRVGMAAAKGLALALKVPVVGVVSLDAMARAAGAEHWPCAALIDAKKAEVFIAMYGADGTRTEGPLHIPCDDVAEWLTRRSGGTGALTVVGEVLEGLGFEAGSWIRGHERDLPGSLSTATLAEEAWRRDPVDQIESLEPLYVRPPDITLPASRSTRAVPCA
jgi:tRNA threonylcarbamoyladenosine biosynthesis protein TsaB